MAARADLTPWFRWDGGDLILDIRAQPRASRNQWQVVGGQLKVKVTSAPVDGAANVQLLKFVATSFGVAPSRVELLRGTSARYKQIRILAPQQIPPLLADQLKPPR